MKRFYLSYLVAFLMLSLLSAQVPESDSLALVALYDSTNGAAWTHDINWLQPGQPVSTWYGITVTNDSVTSIDLESNNLSGVFPPQIGNISKLQYLNLNSNALAGPVPEEIGNLSKLKFLYLHDNQLTGPIPAEIGNLSNLTILELYRNQLTDPIPPEIGNLSNATSLNMGYNQLTDSIPAEIGELSNLQHLHLNDNQLTGSIPAEVGNLSNLRILWLNYNQLTGSIPAEIGNMSNLLTLDLSENQLTGAIPADIGNLENLLYLYIKNNQLTGSIPAELSNLSYLESLHLDNNHLIGTIPAEIGDLVSLRWLNLCCNQLTGSIPVGISDFFNLQGLELNNNQLTGPIPEGIKSLWGLSNLHIFSNHFTFSDLEPITGISISTFLYSPQYQIQLDTIKINKSTGNELQLDITDLAVNEVTAINNEYQWWKDDSDITTGSATPLLLISDLDVSDAGYYHCKMTNSDFPNLTLYTDSVLLVMNGPVDISVTPNDIDENMPAGTNVGILFADDYDQLGGHSFTLAEGDGFNDEDNDLFTINTDELIINHSPDYETQMQYHIYIRAEDDDSKTFDKTLTIAVNDITEISGIINTTEDHWSIYPNPARGEFYISFDGADFTGMNMEVINSAGEVVHQSIINNDKQKINLYYYTAGIYMVKISGRGIVYLKKIVLE